MQNLPQISQLNNELKKNFKKELQAVSEEKFGNTYQVNRSRIRDFAIFLYDHGGDLINIAINDLGEKFELIYEYHLPIMRNRSKYLFISTEVDKKANEIDSIKIVYPQAFWMEKEIEKRYGLKFILFSEEVSEELFAVPVSLVPEDSNFNLLPLGVFNKIHLNHNYFLLNLDKKDKILSVDENTGWTYRGIIELLKRKDLLTENLRITKHICYPGSFHHHLAYIMAIEQLYDITPQPKVKLIRTMLCELERVENSIIFFSNLLFLLGYKRGSNFLVKKRILLIQWYEEFLGERYLEDLNKFGYCNDFLEENLQLFQQKIAELFPSLVKKISHFVYKSYVETLCQGIGVLTKKESQKAGVTGHCLRASGINYDIRYEKPYLSYIDERISKSWEIATCTEGDVFSRIKVKLYEMRASIRLINAILPLIIDNDAGINVYNLSNRAVPKNKIAISQVESPSGGELTYYLKTNASSSEPGLDGVYICTPSMKNFLALNEFILKGNDVKDFPLIVHSMDLNFNEIDL